MKRGPIMELGAVPLAGSMGRVPSQRVGAAF